MYLRTLFYAIGLLKVVLQGTSSCFIFLHKVQESEQFKHFTDIKWGLNFPSHRCCIACTLIESSHHFPTWEKISGRHEGSSPKSIVPNMHHKILNFVSLCCYLVFGMCLFWGCHLVRSEGLVLSVTPAVTVCLQNAPDLYTCHNEPQAAKLSTRQWLLFSHAEPWESLDIE